LAAAYGAEFPVSDGAAFRRIGDREAADAALDSDLKKDASADEASRHAILDEADQLSKDAKALRERLNDSRPSSAEADQVLARSRTLQVFVQSHRLATAPAAWAGVSEQLAIVAAAYRVPWPLR
jgi:hypothetical protein